MKKDIKKHAYLIIAHKFDETFKTLIRMIDYEKNDIFFHIDKKCLEYDFDEVEKIINKSKVYYTKRTDVRWGGSTQINAELLLLELSTNTNNYKYYHLISGQDLPIKSQEYIHKYLEDKNEEFLEVVKDEPLDEYRVKYFHFLSNKLNVIDNIKRDKKFQKIQEKLGIYRNKDLNVRKGSNWFSITDDLARYIVSKKNYIRKKFRWTIAADELFIQTIICDTKYKNNLNQVCKGDNFSGNMREIDWIHCNGMNPHIWTLDDLDTLTNSKCFFARKFDEKIDCNVIRKIEELYK